MGESKRSLAPQANRVLQYWYNYSTSNIHSREQVVTDSDTTVVYRDGGYSQQQETSYKDPNGFRFRVRNGYMRGPMMTYVHCCTINNLYKYVCGLLVERARACSTSHGQRDEPMYWHNFSE